MPADQLRVTPLDPERRREALALWQALWGGGRRANRRYFDWKFLANPAAVADPVHTVLLGDRLVGLAAVHGTRWSAGSDAEVVPCVGDLLVDEELRGSDAFALLLDAVDRSLRAAGHRFAFDFASGRYVPTMVLRGWRSIGPLVTAERRGTGSGRSRSPGRLGRWPGSGGGGPLDRLGPSAVDGVAISAEPRPRAMAELIERLGLDRRLRAVRDRRYLTWRYANPLAEYRFLFAGGSELDGFAVLGTSRARTGAGDGSVAVVDCEAVTDEVRHRLLAAAVCADVDRLKAWPRPGTDDEAGLAALGFELDRPTGRAMADVYRPTVLVRQLDGGVDGRLDGCPVAEAASWDPRMVFFDER